MKARYHFMLLIFLVFGYGPLLAQTQEHVISGRILDEEGNALPGAAIYVEGTYLGTYSRNDGSFVLRIPEGGTYSIKVSFTGYDPVSKEVEIPRDREITFKMERKILMTEEVIVSATRADNRTPVAYEDVTYEEISNRNSGQDIPFLLGLTPSLIETSEAGTGIGYTGLRIRGTEGSRINVSIDGIPLNDAESQQVFWVDLPDLASSVENIQVQRGVGTSANGAGAFGASLNIQTRIPEEEPFAEVNTAGGSFKTIKNTISAGTGLLSGRFSLQLRLSDIKSDGYIRRSGSDNKSAHIGGVYKDEHSLLKANLIMGEEHTRISWWGVPADFVSTDRRYNPAGIYHDENGNEKFYDNETDNYWQNHYQLIYSYSPNNSLILHSALFYTSGKGYYEEYREDQDYLDYGLQPVSADTSLIHSTDMIRRKWLSNDFYGMVWSLKLKLNKLNVLFGGGLNRYDGDHFGRLIWMGNAGNTEKDYQWYFNNARKDEFSIYGKFSYDFTEKLSGFADLQYRYINYKMAGPDDDLKDITQQHVFNFFNPKAGIFCTIASNQDAYISLSVANREPSRSDFKEASGDENATPRSETLYDVEAGYNLRLTRLSFNANLYGMIYRDQLVPTGELSDVGYPIMTNVEESYRTGLELIASMKPVKNLDITINTTLSRNKIPGFISYYLDYNTSDWSSEYKNSDLGTVDIAYSPGATASGDITYHINGRLKLSITGKYVGKQYFDNTMNDNRKIDPYFVSNLRITFTPEIRITKSAEFQILVNNLFNNLYISNAYGGIWYEDGNERTWAYYFPQAGINFLMRANIKF